MPFQLRKLLTDVFQPDSAETVLVMVDTPTLLAPDNADWKERRAMAAEWRAEFQSLGLQTFPLLRYAATGASNSDLPENGALDGQAVAIADLLEKTNIAVAMTRFSATAPLVAFTRKFPRLRAASMPNVLRRMENSALAADYQVVAQKAKILSDLLEDAVDAHVVFSTGHEFVFDLRHRHAHADDGQCVASKSDHRVINLPSGEAFIVPYEGERPGDPSHTAGEIPVGRDGQQAVLEIRENKIVRVDGDSKFARQLDKTFGEDEARRNVAELGLGCNDAAIVTGNVLEDEKAGFHWAYGRSEHLGGTVGPEAFASPEHVVHHDIVYARGCPIGIRQLTLTFPDRETETIMRDSEYRIF